MGNIGDCIDLGKALISIHESAGEVFPGYEGRIVDRHVFDSQRCKENGNRPSEGSGTYHHSVAICQTLTVFQSFFPRMQC